MDLVTALQKCGGAARWGRLRDLGVTGHALRTGVAQGLALPAGRGGYALIGCDPRLVQAVRLGGVVSHAAAADLHGFDSWRPAEGLDVTVPRGSRQSTPGVRMRRRTLTDRDVDGLRPVTGAERTAVDCGRSLPLLDATIVLDSALRSCAIRPDRLHAAARDARGHGATALRRAVRHTDELAGSALESALRLLLGLLGTDVRTQVWIRGVGTVDFVLDGWLVIEADGFAFHADRDSYRTDRRRANGLAERGYVLLRFTWEDVRLRPGWVVRQVERVLRTGPRR